MINTLSSLLPLLTREQLRTLCDNENIECDIASSVEDLAKEIIDRQALLLEDVLGGLSLDELKSLCVVCGCSVGDISGTSDDVWCLLVSNLVRESIAAAECMLRKYFRRSGLPRIIVLSDHADLFCRKILPDGYWTISSCTRGKKLEVCAVCQRTGDSIEAVLYMDTAPGEYGITVPESFFHCKNIWVLDYLEARLPLAKGGTVELLKWIGSAADRVDATIVTWVNTENSPDVVAGVLRKYGGFMEIPAPRLVMHRLCLSERPLSGDLVPGHHHQ